MFASFSSHFLCLLQTERIIPLFLNDKHFGQDMASRKPVKIPQSLCCLQTTTVSCPAALKPCKRVRNMSPFSFLLCSLCLLPFILVLCYSWPHISVRFSVNLSYTISTRLFFTPVCNVQYLLLYFQFLSFSLLFSCLLSINILQSRFTKIWFPLALLIPGPCPLSRKCVDRSHQSATLSVLSTLKLCFALLCWSHWSHE